MKKISQSCLAISLSALHVNALCTGEMKMYFYCALSSHSYQGEKAVGEDLLSIPLYLLRP